MTAYLPFLADSEPWAFLALLVFLALTSPRQRGVKRSGRSDGTGRHRAPDAGETEEREPTAQTPDGP